MAAAFGLRFTLPEYLRRIYRTFPLDLEVFNGDASWTLPMPARFVIDRSGIIRAAEFDPDYTTRPEPAESREATERALTLHPQGCPAHQSVQGAIDVTWEARVRFGEEIVTLRGA